MMGNVLCVKSRITASQVIMLLWRNMISQYCKHVICWLLKQVLMQLARRQSKQEADTRSLNSLLPGWGHPTHSCPAKFVYLLLYSPVLFGKKLFSMQDKLVNNKQTHFLKQNFSATITPIDKRCEMLINLWINPVVCWYCLLMLVFIIV